MAVKTTVGDLVARWRELRAQGREASIEDLCRNHPELLDLLREALDPTSSTRGEGLRDVPNDRGIGLDSPGSSFEDRLNRALLDPAESGESVTEDMLNVLAPPQGAEEIGRLGPYRVVKLLGAGGMGAVFQAVDARLGRLVALKILQPRLANSEVARKRFLREARAAAAIEHEHVVAIYHVGEDRGTPYIAMPFLRGRALDDRLKDGRPAPISEILRIGREIAEGLAAAHEHGMIHRDIKPGNIWLEGSKQRVKILDFGLAHAATEVDAHLTQSGAVLGTPAYMAPEQATGGKVDHRCDLYSLGVVLYVMATGRAPFNGRSAAMILASLLRDDPVPPRDLNPDLPKPLAALIMKLMSKDSARRPPTARAVVDVIEAIERERLEFTLPGLEVERPQSLLDSAPRTRPSPRLGINRSIIFAALVGLFCLPLAYYAFQITRVATDKGELVIETDDPNVQVMVQQDGRLITILDRKTGRKVELKSGSYDIALFRAPDTLTLSTSHFTLHRGKKEIVKITLKPKPATQLEASVPVASKPNGTAGKKASRPEAAAGQEEPDGDIARLTAALKANPGDAGVLEQRGNAYRQRGDNKLALDDYTKAIELEPNSRRYEICAWVHVENAEWEQALANIERAHKMDPLTPMPLVARGWVNHLRGDDDRAMADYNEILRTNPQFSPALNGRAGVYLAQKKLDLALADYNESIRVNPRGDMLSPPSESYIGRSAVHRAKGDRTKALADMEMAFRLAPGSSANLRARGDLHHENKNYEEARADFTQALAIDPHDAFAYAGRSQALLELHDLKGALDDADECLRRNPRFAWGYLFRARIRDARGETKEAIVDYTRALQYDPTIVYALRGRADAYARQGDEAKARADREAAEKLDQAGKKAGHP